MTFILDESNNRMLAGKWIEANHPENGLFRVYWGEGLRVSTTPKRPKREFDGVLMDVPKNPAMAYEINYKDGNKDGPSKGWRHNQTLKSEWNWKDDKPHGIHNEYYGIEDDYGVQNYNGKSRINWKETYDDGILHGKQTWWYRNGQKWKEETKEYGELKGRSTWWSCNGQKEYERFYLNGEFELSLGNYYGGWDEKHIHDVNKKYESGEIISISDGIIQMSDTKGVIFTFTKNDSTKFEWVIPKDVGGGRYIEWYKNGLMKKRAYWEGNDLTSSEFWDENGNEIIYPVNICTGVAP
jgi:antitoxin component YwqK of YwqJK toxin-antitoxin module